MSRIVVIEPLGISSEELDKIIKKYIDEEITYYDTKTDDKIEIIKRIGNHEIVVLAQTKVDAEIIDACKNIKFINIAFTGVDHVDVKYCQQKGINVSNCSGYSTVAVSELVFGLIINLARNINACDKATKESKDKTGLVGFELAGKTIGIIGCGKIGSYVCKLALAFGMNVLIYSNHNPNIENTKFVSLEELLKESDIVSLHVPANESTKHLIGEKELVMMKPTSLLINTARGAVVDNEALTKALNDGKIAGAGIDVFDYEPALKQDYCLLHAKNCLLTPHVGFASKQAFIKRAHIVGSNLKSYFSNNQENKIV